MLATVHSNVEVCAFSDVRARGVLRDAWATGDADRMIAAIERSAGLASSRERVHNILCDECLDDAWPYVLANTSAVAAINRFEVGTGSTAAAETDADLGTLLAAYTQVMKVRRGAKAHFVFYLSEDLHAGSVLREGGLRFPNDGTLNAKVQDKFAGRFVHSAVTKAATNVMTYHWTIEVGGASAGSEVWLDQGLAIVASKLIDETEYGAVSHFVIGTAGITETDTFDTKLRQEVYRESAGVSAGTAQITGSGTITTGEYTGGGTITEAGPAVGAASNAGQVAYLNVNVDGAATMTYSFTLALANG